MHEKRHRPGSGLTHDSTGHAVNKSIGRGVVSHDWPALNVLQNHEEQVALLVADDLDQPHQILVRQQLHHIDLPPDRIRETSLKRVSRVRGGRDRRP